MESPDHIIWLNIQKGKQATSTRTATRYFRRACETLAENYSWPVLRYCQTQLPQSDAEDVAQQTFLTCFEEIQEFKGTADDIERWVIDTANNTIRASYRLRRGWPDVRDAGELERLAAQARPHQVSDEEDEKGREEQRKSDLQDRALKRLPRDMQIELRLRWRSQEKRKEITAADVAYILGTTVETARKHYQRNMGQLRAKIAEIEQEDQDSV